MKIIIINKDNYDLSILKTFSTLLTGPAETSFFQAPDRNPVHREPCTFKFKRNFDNRFFYVSHVY